MGFDFHELLRFQNLGSFVELKKGYDESQIKAFYCNAQKQDSVSFECAFKNVRIALNPEKRDSLVQLDCSRVDIEVKDEGEKNHKKGRGGGGGGGGVVV